MDVNRIESVAVPTAIAGLTAGAAGYVSTKAIKNGQMTNKFSDYIVDSFTKNNEKLMKEADKLDKINPFITNKDVGDIILKKLSKDELSDIINERTPQEYKEYLIEKNGIKKDILEFAQKKMKKADESLEKFARKHAKELGITTGKDQPLADAIKAFLKNKDAAAVKEIFLPESTRRVLNSTDYKTAIKEEFADVFDSTTKKFKEGEEMKDSIKFFKKSALNMKLKQAGIFAGIASGIALLSSAAASKLTAK